MSNCISSSQTWPQVGEMLMTHDCRCMAQSELAGADSQQGHKNRESEMTCKVWQGGGRCYPAQAARA